MYENWIQDIKDKHEFSRNYSILTGSFSNMDLAQKMIGGDGSQIKSSDKDFESTVEMIEEDIKKEDNKVRKRRRGVIR